MRLELTSKKGITLQEECNQIVIYDNHGHPVIAAKELLGDIYFSRVGDPDFLDFINKLGINLGDVKVRIADYKSTSGK